MTLYMFQTVFPSIISSSRLYIQQQAYVSCMYSPELLMMDGKTETCSVSFQNKITLIHWCIWLVGFTIEILWCTALWMSKKWISLYV